MPVAARKYRYIVLFFSFSSFLRRRHHHILFIEHTYVSVRGEPTRKKPGLKTCFFSDTLIGILSSEETDRQTLSEEGKEQPKSNTTDHFSVNNCIVLIALLLFPAL
jgi:hypothetical protein